MNNIVLIGMPGAGKSTVGVVLAKRLGYRFVDSDLVIQEAKGMLLHEIIEERGIEGFLAVENEIKCFFECKAKRDCHRRKRHLWERGHGAFRGKRHRGLFKVTL